MLTAECYRQRMEKGLTFLEFNYMIMQSYDFLELFKRHNCILQTGGDDQWSNILSGADLIRRKEQRPAFALTFKLLLTSDGRKMGKTEKGALWLDGQKTPPYDFFQYWRNIADADVRKSLAMLTFLPMEEVDRLARLEGSAINEAKTVLAFETTKLVHGQAEAEKAREASSALFAGGGSMTDVPTFLISASQLAQDSRLTTILFLCGLCSSRSDARKMVQQGAVMINEDKITDASFTLSAEDIPAEGLLLRRGKKHYCRLMMAP